MTSQLNVDTIVDKAGSGGSSVKMANTSTYVSDGGNATQNTVQGLTKAWVNFNGTGTIAARDSFNLSSLTDVASGRYKTVATNAFGNINYAPNGASGYDDTGMRVVSFPYDGAVAGTTTATPFQVNYVNDTLQERTYIFVQIVGDLA